MRKLTKILPVILLSVVCITIARSDTLTFRKLDGSTCKMECEVKHYEDSKFVVGLGSDGTMNFSLKQVQTIVFSEPSPKTVTSEDTVILRKSDGSTSVFKGKIKLYKDNKFAVVSSSDKETIFSIEQVQAIEYYESGSTSSGEKKEKELQRQGILDAKDAEKIKDVKMVEPGQASQITEKKLTKESDENESAQKTAPEALDKPDSNAENQKVIYLIAKRDWDKCAEIGKPAVEPLIATLADKDFLVRQGAARTLGEIGDARAVAPLIHKLDDNWVRLMAVHALGKIGNKRAVGPLLAILKDDTGDIFKKAVIRSAAARALGEIGDKRAVEPLIAALNDRTSVGNAAGHALGEIGDKRAVEPLIAALNRRGGLHQMGAAAGLGEIGDARAVEPLIAKLKGRGQILRKQAIESLGKIGEPAVERLITELKSENLQVRQGAALALNKSGWKAKNEKEKVSYLIAGRNWKECVKVGGPAVGALISMLESEDNLTIRCRAIETLGKIGDARAVEPLIAALKDKRHIGIELAIEIALAKIGKPAVQPLINELGNNHAYVRKAAVETLGKMGDARAIEPLIATLHDKDSDVRKAAAEALDKLGWEGE